MKIGIKIGSFGMNIVPTHRNKNKTYLSCNQFIVNKWHELVRNNDDNGANKKDCVLGIAMPYFAGHASRFEVGLHFAAMPKMKKNTNAADAARYTPAFPEHTATSSSFSTFSHPEVHASERYCQLSLS